MLRLSRVFTAAALTLACGIAAPASAQQVVSIGGSSMSFGDGPGAGGRTITSASLEKYTALFNLDSDQHAAAKAFHEEYLRKVQETETSSADARKKMREMMEDGDHDAAMKKMGEAFAAAAKVKTEATTEFLGNLKQTLTADQATRWDRLERMRRRENVGGLGFMVGGAGVDLVELVGTLKLPATESSKIAATLEEYERDFDAAVQGYQGYQTKRADEERKNKKEGEVTLRGLDMAEIQSHMQEEQKQAGKLRDVNKQYVAKFGANLAEEWKAKLDKEWLSKAYRRIYGESHTTKQLKTALGFGDLSAEQKTRLTEIFDSYEKELAAANARWLDEQQKAEGEGVANPLPFMDQNMPEGLKKARKDRRELDTRFSKQVRELLTEEQKERLPKRQGGIVLPDGGEILPDLDIDGGAVDIQIMTTGQ